MSEATPPRIPDWLHLILSIVLSVLALILVYAIIFVLSDLVSNHLFAIDLKDRWIGIISISLAFLITFAWIRRIRARTEATAQKRNLRWTANLIILIFIGFLAFIAYRVYQQDFDLPELNDYTSGDQQEIPLDSTAVDSGHASLDSLEMASDTIGIH